MIYAIQTGPAGPVKVGWTRARDATGRLRQLQVGRSERLALLDTWPGGRDREQALHARLARWRLDGEWYDPAGGAMLASLREELEMPCYERTDDGRAILVLWRPTEREPTQWCPFCGRRHRHGASDGPRAPHCDDGALAWVVCLDGTVLRWDRGYIIRTLAPARDAPASA